MKKHWWKMSIYKLNQPELLVACPLEPSQRDTDLVEYIITASRRALGCRRYGLGRDQYGKALIPVEPKSHVLDGMGGG